jgi:SAM-dependent methyltransferase
MTGAATRIVKRLYGVAREARRDRDLLAVANRFAGARVIEPGGPSRLFLARGIVPVYPLLGTLDVVDYAERTIWSHLEPGDPLNNVRVRRRLIGEAGKLDQIADGAYDALLASHVLEHLANPLSALHDWKRVVHPGGLLLLVVPHRDATFDHQRPVTSLAHMRDDAEHTVGEDDLTHLDEARRLTDLTRDPHAPSQAVFEERCRENATTRAMHHHIFISRTVAEVCTAAGLQVLLLKPKLPFDIVCLCGVEMDRVGGLDDRALSKLLARSPFPSDNGRQGATGSRKPSPVKPASTSHEAR